MDSVIPLKSILTLHFKKSYNFYKYRLSAVELNVRVPQYSTVGMPTPGFPVWPGRKLDFPPYVAVSWIIIFIYL